MKYTCCVAVMDTAAARALLPHESAPPASSLPALQPKGRSHVGQPVPKYSTVLLAVWPHVVTVSTPPRGAVASRYSAYTSRGPGKNVWKPPLHVPDVYMPPLPDDSVDAGVASPLFPASTDTRLSPPPARQTGRDGDGVLVADHERDCVLERVDVGEVVDDGERVPDAD